MPDRRRIGRGQILNDSDSGDRLEEVRAKTHGTDWFNGGRAIGEKSVAAIGTDCQCDDGAGLYESE